MLLLLLLLTYLFRGGGGGAKRGFSAIRLGLWDRCRAGGCDVNGTLKALSVALQGLQGCL